MQLLEGVATANWLAVADYFGRRSFGRLVGLMTPCHSVMGLVAPFASGWVFDHTGSYTWVLLPAAALLLLAGVAFALARRPGVP